jgi:hypothetical protein
MQISLAELRSYLKKNTRHRFPLGPEYEIELQLDEALIEDSFKLKPGDRVLVNSHKATVIGLDRCSRLYFLPDHKYKVKRSNLRSHSNMTQFGIRKIEDDQFVHPLILEKFAHFIQREITKREVETKFGVLATRKFSKYITSMWEVFELTQAENFFFSEDWFVHLSDHTAKQLENTYQQILSVDFNHPPLFNLVLLRLLQLAILQEGFLTTHLQKLNQRKCQFALALIQTGEEPDLCLNFLTDPHLDRFYLLEIANKFWQQRAHYDSAIQTQLTRIILSLNFCPEQELSSFIVNLQRDNLIEQTEINAYLANALLTANRYAAVNTNKDWEEALKWYKYALSTPRLTQADLKFFETCSLLTIKLSDSAQSALNFIRLKLCEIYNVSHNPTFYKIFPLIDSAFLTAKFLERYERLHLSYLCEKYNLLSEALSSTADILNTANWRSDTGDEAIEAHFFQTKLMALVNELTPLRPIQTIDYYEQQLEGLQNKIGELLKERWHESKSKQLCYTHNIHSFINQKCIQLAELRDSAHKYTSLMSTLIEEEDGYGNHLNDLALGEFFLSDDDTHFIAIKPVIHNLIARTEQGETDAPLLSYLMPDRQAETPLSASEQARLFSLIPLAAELLTLAKNRLAQIACHPLGAFQALRLGLLKGEVNYQFEPNEIDPQKRAGKELDAGSDANEALVEFMLWFNQLSLAKQRELKKLKDDQGQSFKQILDNLIRTEQNAKSNQVIGSRYCVQLIGRDLETIIHNNKEKLTHFRTDQQEKWAAIKAQVLDQLDQLEAMPKTAKQVFKPYWIDYPALFKQLYLFLSNERQRLTQCNPRRLFDLYDALLVKANQLLKLSDPSNLSFHSAQQALLTELNVLLVVDKELAACSLDTYRQYLGCHASNRKLLLAISEHPHYFGSKTQVKLFFAHAGVGTPAFFFRDGTLRLYLCQGKGQMSSHSIHLDLTQPNKPFFILSKNQKKEFYKLEQAIDEINSEVTLTHFSQLRPLYLKLNQTIYHPETCQLLQRALLNLRSALLNQTFSQLKLSQPESIITKTDIEPIIYHVSHLVGVMNSDMDHKIKQQTIIDCHRRLIDIPLEKSLSHALLIVLVAASFSLLFATAGIGLGLVAGPAAVGTGLAGLSAGWLIGTSVGTTLTGVTTGSLAAFCLFKKTTREKIVYNTLKTAARLPEEDSCTKKFRP